jgi:CubicO group peptidase (beta-lactamase class C family)
VTVPATRSSRRPKLLAVALAACVGLTAGGAALPLGLVTSVKAADSAAAVIAKYQVKIPELMAEQNVPGVAVALVDGDQVLWAQGFGHVDGDGSAASVASIHE